MEPSGTPAIRDFYDRRATDAADLNTRCATGEFLAHHHSGLVRPDDPVPADPAEQPAWLYHTEQALCDYLWRVVEPLAPRPIRVVLDAGCGEGATLQRFRALAENRPLDTWGITLSPAQADNAARRLPDASWIVGDMLTSDRLPAGRFDLVVAIESTEYLGEAALPRFFQRASGWLAAGGGLLAVIAGTRAEGLPSASEVVRDFDGHYVTQLAPAGAYRDGASQAGMDLVADVDLGPATIPYWQCRSGTPGLQNSPDGRVEAMIARGLVRREFQFRLFVWQRGPR